MAEPNNVDMTVIMDEDKESLDIGSSNKPKATHDQEKEAAELLGMRKEQDPAKIRIGELKVYQRRWLILAVVALLNNSNTMSWISFAPVANFVDEFYQRKGAANWFSLVYMLCTIPVGFFAMWTGRRFGLRTAILLAGWANGVGALIRFISSFLSPDIRFPVGIVGQCIASIAYPFIMFLPTKVAGSWFPDHQRALATTIGIMSNPLGVLLANVLAPQLVHRLDHVVYLNAVTFIPSAIACILAAFFVDRSSPKLPPTVSAGQQQLDFWPGLWKCLNSRAYLILLLVMGGGIGMFNCLYTIMQQLLCPQGYHNSFAGLCCALMIIGGLFGASFSGIFVDRTKLYKETMKVALSLAVLTGILFVQLALRPNLHSIIAATCLLFGALGLATYPVGLEMSAECTFPVSETTSTGLIVLSGQVQSAIYILVMTSLSRPLSSSQMSVQVCRPVGSDIDSVIPKDMTTAAIAFSAIGTVLAVILVFAFHPKYRRLAMEKNVDDIDELQKDNRE